MTELEKCNAGLECCYADAFAQVSNTLQAYIKPQMQHAPGACPHDYTSGSSGKKIITK